MKFPITMYQDEEGWYVVECPIVPGCLSQGKTKEEALENIQEAIQLCLEVRQQEGLPPTIQSLEVEIPAYAPDFFASPAGRLCAPSGARGGRSPVREGAMRF